MIYYILTCNVIIVVFLSTDRRKEMTR